jgi:hypothetical protein
VGSSAGFGVILSGFEMQAQKRASLIVTSQGALRLDIAFVRNGDVENMVGGLNPPGRLKFTQ